LNRGICGSYPEGGSLGNHIVVQREIKDLRESAIKMEKELILEIGTEEIPAGFLREAIKNLGSNTEQEFQDNLLSYKNISTFGTPRRLTLRVSGLSEKQSDKIVEILGPPKRIAFDESGTPTKAALGFAKAQGVNVRNLVVVEREKGDVVAIRRKITGKRTETVLKSLLSKIILSITFRKSMRWGDGDTSFARPIRWILALYGGKTVPFSLEQVKSGSKTQGHRFISPKPFRVGNWDEYISELEERFVILDQEKRKEIIKRAISQIANEIGGVPLEDEELLETVTHLVEYPVVLKGNFNKEFLELPKEVLISVMKNNQKYFPVFSDSRKSEELLPHFIFVSGTPVKNPQIVIKGNERVIKSRFTDAKFLFEEDIKTPLSDKIERLKGMVFLSDLGTYYDKVERLGTRTATMESLAKVIGIDLGFHDLLKDLERAARLSKADLVTQMVFEFPELQGTMGKYYALISGEKEEIAIAIEEQYMPTSREGKLPRTNLGSILSIADKIDTISACFISGLTPTGTSDPYALRRQAIAVINIILNMQFHLSLRDIFYSSLRRICDQFKKPFSSNPLTEIVDFMVERFRNLMISEGFPQDVVDAVIFAERETSVDGGKYVEDHDIVETKRKIEALSDFRKAPDFDSLAIAFKRVVNIVKGQPRGRVNRELLIEPTEKLLYQVYLEVKQEVQDNISRREYIKALTHMKSLKEKVDKYFDDVLVMAENENIRLNRLSTLWEIRELFFKVADFSKIST
jgi:glycyl-tRNA synthetase beta chain